MKHHAELDGHRHSLEVERRDDGGYRVVLDGRPLPLDAREIAPGVYSLLLGTDSFDVRVVADPTGESVRRATVSLRGETFVVALSDPYRRSMDEDEDEDGDAEGRRAGGEKRLLAPMHGKIVRVLCKAGDRVERGQGLVVMEAMKMENELKAAHDGVVTELRAAVGQSVNKGVLLAVIEPGEPRLTAAR